MQNNVPHCICQILTVMHVIPLGGFFPETKVIHVKYVLSPYTLDLVATPLFLKPGIPYSIKVR